VTSTSRSVYGYRTGLFYQGRIKSMTNGVSLNKKGWVGGEPLSCFEVRDLQRHPGSNGVLVHINMYVDGCKRSVQRAYVHLRTQSGGTVLFTKTNPQINLCTR
jgi:hypothetical protein